MRDLGRVGIWCSPLRRGDLDGALAAAAEIEKLGFKSVWMPGGETGLFERVSALLAGTQELVYALGIVNIWYHSPAEVARLHALSVESKGRLALGLGIGHQPLVEKDHPGAFGPPIASMQKFLDELDSSAPRVPASDRVLAALGPRMLELARDRSRGAHPYLVTPEHTGWARTVLGQGPLLAPEQHVVLDSDLGRARATAREYLATYWSLPNYINNYRRMGFCDDDFAGGGSDRLVDALVACGSADDALERARRHLDAGADHVALQVLVPGRRGFPVAGWQALAPAAEW